MQSIASVPGLSNPEEIISEINERSRRASNVMLFNLKESASRDIKAKQDHDMRLVTKIITTMNAHIDIAGIKTLRVGRSVKDKVRPLKLVLKSSDEAKQFLRNFSKDEVGKADPSLMGISVSSDKTLKERQFLNKLREELGSRVDKGERDLTIKYLSGVPSIVKADPSTKNV